jgi:hypothetical protein
MIAAPRIVEFLIHGTVAYRATLTSAATATLELLAGPDRWRLVCDLALTPRGWCAADERRLSPAVVEALDQHLAPQTAPAERREVGLWFLSLQRRSRDG